MWGIDGEKRKEDAANAEITKCDALLLLLGNNVLAAEVHIGGMVMGVCDNTKLKPAIQHHKDEIQKFLDGEKSEWDD